VFISFGVLLFLFRNKSGFHPVVYFSFGYFWKLFIIVLTNTPLNVGSYTGLIMIVGIISENAILPIYSLKPLLVQNNKISGLCNFNAFKTKINDCFRTIALLPLRLVSVQVQSCINLAIAVIGVLIAMPLLLIVLPSLLYYFDIEQKLANYQIVSSICLLF
jgi:Cu/Ag efflux pump CusA